MESQDPLAARFSRLLESGMSREETWKMMAVEILVDAGIIAPEHLEPSPASTRTESVQIPVLEAKLVKAIRIEPRMMTIGRCSARPEGRPQFQREILPARVQ